MSSPRTRLRPSPAAPLVTRRGGSTAGATPLPGTYVTFPDVILANRLFVAIGQDPNLDPDLWTWTEIPPNYILWRDAIRTSRGRKPSQTQASPATLNLSLKNAQGRYTWALGTPMRYTLDPGTGDGIQFTGFVVTMNPRSDTSGNDRWLSVQASGVLQRMGRQPQPAHSATWGAVAGALPADGSGTFGSGRPDVAFWWSLEDGAGSTSGASAVIGAPAMASSGVTFAAATVPAGIAAAPNVAGGILTGEVSAYPDNVNQELTFYFQAVGACTVASWTLSGACPGHWQLIVDGSGTASLTVDGVAGLASIAGYPLLDGNFHAFSVTLEILAGQLYAFLNVGDGTLGSGINVFAASTSIGNIGNIIINPLSSASMVSVSMVAGGPVFIPLSEDVMNGSIGQGAIVRFVAICHAEGIPFEVAGDVTVDNSGSVGVADVNGKFEVQATMGARSTISPLAHFRECEAAEDGFLVESREGRIRLDFHDQRENLPVAVQLTIGGNAAQVVPPFEPNIDDQRIINDATVLSSRDTEEFGQLGVNQAGRYDSSFPSISLEDVDSQSLNRASFEAMRGTRAEPRFDSVTINMAKSPELIPWWMSGDPIGSHVEIDNLHGTVWLSEAHQLVDGYDMVTTQKTWDITLSLSPEAPYRTFVVEGEENLGRLDNPDSTLAGDLSDDWTITTIQVASPSGLWRTGPADWPLCLAGSPPERVEVVSIAGSSSPQTFTITRHEGKTVPHLDGASATLWRPGVLALHSRRTII